MTTLPSTATCWPWPKRPWMPSRAFIRPLGWQYRGGTKCAWCGQKAVLLVDCRFGHADWPACDNTICIDHLARVENHYKWKNGDRLKKRKAANIHRWGYTRGLWPKEDK